MKISKKAFNEAPARGGGGPVRLGKHESRVRTFNEAPARGGGGRLENSACADFNVDLQ